MAEPEQAIPDDLRRIANDIMAQACLSEVWVKNGVDAALRLDIARALMAERLSAESRGRAAQREADASDGWISVPVHGDRMPEQEVIDAVVRVFDQAANDPVMAHSAIIMAKVLRREILAAIATAIRNS